MLRKYPGIGFPEPLLKDYYIPYKATIVGRYHKIIYYVKGDTLRIVAFWDMRMHPKKLQKKDIKKSLQIELITERDPKGVCFPRVLYL